MQSECSKNIGPTSPGSRTSGNYNQNKSNQLTLFAADFLASHSAKPGSDKARMMTATSGRKLFDCFKAGNGWDGSRLGACLRMLLATSAWASMTCFLTWKERVTPAGRSLFQLVPSMPRTDGIGFGFWPTPTVSGNHNRKGASPSSGDGLATAVKMFPTPTARDWKSGKASQATMERNARPLSEVVGGSLNPEFVEYLMGYPIGYTDCEHSETASSLPSLSE